MLQVDEDMNYTAARTSSGSSSPDLMSEDMRLERDRQHWEEEAYIKPHTEEEGEDKRDETRKDAPIHYQTVKHKGKNA